MNGQTEDRSPLAKAVDELEHIKGRRLPLAWTQLARLNAVDAVTGGVAKSLRRFKEAIDELNDTYGKDSPVWGWWDADDDAALEAYEKALNV